MSPNERYVGELLQTEYDELLSRLVDADSYVSWCRHRHHNPKDVQAEMDEFVAFARKHGRRNTVTRSASESKQMPPTQETDEPGCTRCGNERTVGGYGTDERFPCPVCRPTQETDPG